MKQKKIENITNYIHYCEKFYIDKVSGYSITHRINYLAYLAMLMASNSSQYFSSSFLESELNTISESLDIQTAEVVKSNSTLHIMTEAYATGGHTKLVEQWIENLEYQYDNSVLLLNYCSEIPASLNDIVSKNGKIIKLKKENYVNLAKKVALIASGYEKIVLHIHPHEILANLAFANTKFTRPVLFLNHADHMFNCGYSVCSAVLELSTEGAYFSRKVRGIKNNYFLPIPVNKNVDLFSKKEAREKLGINLSKKIILSIASEYKYGKGSDVCNFINMAKNIIANFDNCEFILIGPSRKNLYWNEAYESTNGKINPIGIQPRAILNQYADASDLYIESFPFASYMALLDIVTHNVNVLTLKTETFTMDCIKNSNCQCNSIQELEGKAVTFLSNPSAAFIPNIKNHYKENWVEIYTSIIKDEANKLQISYGLNGNKANQYYSEHISKIIGFKVISDNYYARLPFLIKIKLLQIMLRFNIGRNKKFKLLKHTFKTSS